MIKKLLVFTLSAIILSALTITGALASTYGKNATFDSFWLSSNGKEYKVHDGLLYTRSATVTDKVTVSDGSVATRITPNASDTTGNPVVLKHTSVANIGVPIEDVKYVRYCYYYEGSYNGRATLTFPASDFGISRERTVYSMEKVTSGSWTYLTFDISQVLFGYIRADAILESMYFRPFGDTAASALPANKSMYLREMNFWGEDNARAIVARSNGTLVQKYPVCFVPGRPDTEGTAPEMLFAAEGETIVLPENTFVRPGYRFDGWICSVGSRVMLPGESYTLKMRKRTGEQNTAAVDFIANWTLLATDEEIAELLPSVKRVPNAPYFMGIVDNRKYGHTEENVMFDGFETTKFVPAPDGADASKHYIMIDGYAYQTLPLDLSHYKCMIIPYYFETTREDARYTPRIHMLGSAEDQNRAVSKTLNFYDNNKLKANEWSLIVFEFDFENNSSINQYLKWEINTTQMQIHFLPFGSTRASSLSEDDAIYFGDLIFLDYIPETRPEISKGFISGDGEGNFNPTDLLTNAQAASVIAKISGHGEGYVPEDSAYTDVGEDDWFFTYVSFLEEKGIFVAGENEKFMPDELCPKDTFLAWSVKANVGKNTYANAFGDIPRGPSSGKYISRAEAVSLACTIVNGNQYTQADADRYMKGQKVFRDISDNQWYYPAVSLSSVASVRSTKDGASEIIDTFIDAPVVEKEFPTELYKDGTAYLKALDTETKKRIEAIRNTKSVYKQKDGGKTVYVSNEYGNGTVENSSETNPVYIRSIKEISNFILNPGDVVLLRRGEVYRGYFDAKAGVTYSAYGDGAKPVIMPSPEDGSGSSNWTLAYSDSETGAKIWKYNNENLTDAGGVNLISSDGTHLVAYKEIPNYNDGVFYDRQNTSLEYDYREMLDHDLMFVHFANRNPSTGTVILNNPASTSTGPLYLRCDKGNPGAVYSRIEFNSNEHAIKIKGHGVTIDNLCIKYFGRHGISAGTVHNLKVTNCEIGWGGGSIQSYNSEGRVTRFGNGVEIYGALMNYIIDNCYVYEIYDAGITHQISSSSSGHYYMESVYYTNNVLLNSTYNIEYFMSKNSVKDADGKVPLQERYMKDVYFTNNITRMAGYGWGVQRPDNAPSNVKGWSHHNLCDNQVYENNVFDRCIDLQNNITDYPIMTGTSYESSTPYLLNNIFVQVPGRIVMMFNKTSYRTDESSEALINRIGGDGNKLYFCPDDSEEYSYMIFWR